MRFVLLKKLAVAAILLTVIAFACWVSWNLAVASLSVSGGYGGVRGVGGGAGFVAFLFFIAMGVIANLYLSGQLVSVFAPSQKMRRLRNDPLAKAHQPKGLPSHP